jgi:hypothetical protein
MPNRVLVNVYQESEKIGFGVYLLPANIFLKKRFVSFVLLVKGLAASVEESSRIV